MSEVRLRPLAEADLAELTSYYRVEGGEELGARFFDTAIDALRMVGRMPGTGSLRIGELSGVPGLRSRRLAGFPCGWFYFERDDYADVVRLLSYAQDLATMLGDVDQDDW
ncbi:MAG: type II toxin-antitoxin system RelE/ParE family toxin [Acidimicrobiales bacterium]